MRVHTEAGADRRPLLPNVVRAVPGERPGPDEDLVRQAKELFEENAGPNMHWFEVWSGRRSIGGRRLAAGAPPV